MRARELADVAVRSLRELPELRHVSEHQPLAPGEPREHLDRGAHRARVGVVGVVDEPGAARCPPELQAPRHGAHRGKSRRDLLEAHPGAARGGRGGERVRDVVQAADREADRDAPAGRIQPEAGAEPFGSNLAAHFRGAVVGRGAHAEGEHARGRERAPERRELVVRVDDGGRPLGEAGDHLALGARHAFEAPEALEVLGAGIGDEANRGTRDVDQGRDLARVIGAHLHHRKAVRGLEAQQRQRHADVVVEIAARGETAARLSEDRGGHFLRGGLAVAAGDPDQRPAEGRAPAASRALERRLGVGHDDLRQRHRLPGVDQRAGGPLAVRGGDELVAVEARSLEGDEQLPALERARVAHHVGVGGVGPREPPATGAREFDERALHAGRPASSATTTA